MENINDKRLYGDKKEWKVSRFVQFTSHLKKTTLLIIMEKKIQELKKQRKMKF